MQSTFFLALRQKLRYVKNLGSLPMRLRVKDLFFMVLCCYAETIIFSDAWISDWHYVHSLWFHIIFIHCSIHVGYNKISCLPVFFFTCYLKKMYLPYTWAGQSGPGQLVISLKLCILLKRKQNAIFKKVTFDSFKRNRVHFT